MPRMLTDIAERDQSIELFGKRYASPLIPGAHRFGRNSGA
jgi:isopentenyl diphosphate isomerase/L-lactate dehydrogenase-like FMN-dependent dehydrogenase